MSFSNARTTINGDRLILIDKSTIQCFLLFAVNTTVTVVPGRTVVGE